MMTQNIQPANAPTYCIRYADGSTPASVAVILAGESRPRPISDPAVSPLTRALALQALRNHNARERAVRRQNAA